jgi:phenylacetate-CoA ligase
MLQQLHRHVLIPAFETVIKRRKIFRYGKELAQSQWLSRQELEQRQLEGLRGLLSHAMQHCPYYRQAWSELGLDPQEVDGLEDFASWPVTGRETILENRLAMRAEVPGMRLISKSTGGSSGVPLRFDLDAGSYDRRTAAWYRGYDWAGAGPGTKQFYFWGVPLGAQPRWRRWKDRLYHRLHRRLLVNTFELSDERVPALLARLNRHRPDVIVAYTNPLYIFARALDERGLRPFAPKAIVVGAEKLHTFQRELLEKVFQAPVFETYGSREVMLMGAECDRHEGLHLTMENLLVEILDDEGRATPAGEEGNVVVTDLYNYGMPFVRYATGDRAVAGWGTCSCGRGLPLLHKVVGRRLDILRTPDGRHIPGEFFPHLLKDFQEVRRFQVIQDNPDHIQLKLVLNGPWRRDNRSLLETEVRKVVGPAIRLDLDPVEDIPLTSSGKLRVVVASCNHEFANSVP